MRSPAPSGAPARSITGGAWIRRAQQPALAGSRLKLCPASSQFTTLPVVESRPAPILGLRAAELLGFFALWRACGKRTPEKEAWPCAFHLVFKKLAYHGAGSGCHRATCAFVQLPDLSRQALSLGPGKTDSSRGQVRYVSGCVAQCS